MSRSLHLIPRTTIPGYGSSDGRCFPCSGVSGKALSMSLNTSRGDYKLVSDVKFLSSRTSSRYTSTVCYASSSNYRRNPDFSRQNKNGFSRYRNRPNEAREEYDDLDESETFSSRNGPVLSVAGNPKFQATTSPGPREKEIIELFRKVHAQLRERAAMKEGRKMEDSQVKSKESDTVDSLLKLLRKHSVQQGKKSSSSSSSADNRDFILDQVPSAEERSTSIPDTSSSEMQESPKPHPTRPKSNFRKRSPVPETTFQPDESIRSISEVNLDLEAEADDIPDIEYDSDPDVGPPISEGNAENDGMAKEEDGSDLHGMKLTELRALAKSRGMKGFSKLKKNELIERLSG